MKIALVGGGSGGHFYPLIAVAEALEDLSKERRLIEPDLYYIGPTPFDPETLLEHEIQHVSGSAGRARRYFSILNIFDVFRTGIGIIRSLMTLFRLYPDVIFSTGGFAAFPTLYAARILGIPVVIYDADALPGRVSLWSSHFARWIALAHPDAAKNFPKKTMERIAQVGHPIRKEIETTAAEGGHEFLRIDASVPTVFILGGSQGAVALNETLLDALLELVTRYNIVHQTGVANLEEVTDVAGVVLKNSPYKDRYRPFGLLNTLALRMTGGIADVIVSRAGSGMIFEIAAWGVPAILVPIPTDVSHDQTENAFSYARAGGASVLEQKNLTPHLLIAEIDRVLGDAALRAKMKEAAKSFARPQAARKIGEILMETALEHAPK